ncbi:hypothetical protein [Sulfurovum mangrovi]|uniref:hypothetical protein n=1 Tax=Sulfurovum mangrovi TaxID=2893889 RepID=UPI001E4F5228|nr:hypothetical protein [Sulfurovum mangrovi]UFH59840.1 hypothetical protein LN246_03105 [Sulfurovum mangrovi]UFH59891.1 hypothetical protein LN246_03365 [Sulfurovum mangrovi]
MVAVWQLLTSFDSHNLTAIYSDYNSGNTYSFGDMVKHDLFDYRSIIDANYANTPDADNGKWLRWKASNITACLNVESEHATVCDSNTKSSGTPFDLHLVFTVSTEMEYVVIKEAHGASMTILEKNSGGTTVKTHNVTIDQTMKKVARDYAFAIDGDTSTIDITVAENSITNSSYIKHLFAGDGYTLGDAMWNPSVEITRQRNTRRYPDGIRSVEYKNELPQSDFDVFYPTSDHPHMVRTAKYMLDLPYAYVLDDTDNSGIENAIIIGYFDVFTPVLQEFDISHASVQIRELP